LPDSIAQWTVSLERRLFGGTERLILVEGVRERRARGELYSKTTKSLGVKA